MREMLNPTSTIMGSDLGYSAALITNDRFSGATRGTVISHVLPEAAVERNIALIQDGDIIIGDRNVLDSDDFIVINLLLPIGSLIFLLFCVIKWGCDSDNYYKEYNTGKGIKFSKALKPYFQFVPPILIIVILVQELR